MAIVLKNVSDAKCRVTLFPKAEGEKSFTLPGQASTIPEAKELANAVTGTIPVKTRKIDHGGVIHLANSGKANAASLVDMIEEAEKVVNRKTAEDAGTGVKKEKLQTVKA